MTPSRIAIAFVALLTLVLSRTPLLNLLGYECSFVLGIALPPTIGLLWLAKQSNALQKWRASLLLIVLPPFAMLLNMLFVRNCDYFEGLVFYILGPAMGSLFAFSLAVAIRSVLEKWQKTAFLLIWLLLLLVPILHRLYASPQIYFFNHFFGFFAGTIYDKTIVLDARYFIFRFETLLFSSAFFLIAFRDRISSFPKNELFSKILQRFPAWAFLALPLLILGLLLAGRNESFGIISSHQAIKKTLAPIDSAGLWFASPTLPLQKRKYYEKRLRHELQDLQRIIGMATLPKVHIFIYPNSATKKRFTGADQTEFTKIWLNEIHITEEAFERSIRHELVHILFGAYGIPHLGLSTSIGILEGVAVALETPDISWRQHDYAAALFKLDMAPKHPEKLLGAFGFWTGLGSMSYTLMGSLVQFLLEKYGMEKFKQAYAWAAFEEVYQKSPEKLISEWKAWLQEVPISQALENDVRYRFSRKSIFETECPHTVARSLREAWAAFEEKNYPLAKSLYQTALDMTEGKNPTAIHGLLAAKIYGAANGFGSPQNAFAEADSLAEKLEKTLPARFTIASARLWTGFGQKEIAVRELEKIYSEKLFFSYSLAAAIRISLAETEFDFKSISSLLCAEEKIFLLQTALDSAQTSTQKSLVAYLLGVELYEISRYEEVLHLLLPLAPFSKPEIEFHRQWLILNAAQQTGRKDLAENAAARAQQISEKLSGTAAKQRFVSERLRLY
ncbi:hypothetical protein Ctha_0804 [Chloroherpeton thalassium ATCC 35110]|uniref:Uncharacterized protein n=1 Tax=Chloroherpeton thalassium (strain ATCC 35110 / GB-78) TaxID=517418 RepID=B3QWQ8_CHLT3|nr:hypothetical protein [Chloroherpeton thalassium]ACF13272.1 hypothetical protein Ctha_0804 [Chloroherpeton thalassium ATCC 35110]